MTQGRCRRTKDVMAATKAEGVALVLGTFAEIVAVQLLRTLENALALEIGNIPVVPMTGQSRVTDVGPARHEKPMISSTI